MGKENDAPRPAFYHTRILSCLFVWRKMRYATRMGNHRCTPFTGGTDPPTL